MSHRLIVGSLLVTSGALLTSSNTLPPFLLPQEEAPAPTSAIEPLSAPPCDSPSLCSIGRGVTLSGSFLWWRASENLSNYAQVVTKENILDAEEGRGYPRGHTQSLRYAWDPGFNVRLGWDTDYDCWDLCADWTWYRNTTKNSISARTNSSFDPTTGLPGTQNGLGIYGLWAEKWIPAHGVDNFSGLPIQSVFPGPFSHATTRWTLSYNTINLEWGRTFKTRANRFRPFFGLRGALIERETRVHYTGYDNLGSLLTPMIELPALFILDGFDSASYKTKMNFWGIGPLLGISEEFKLPQGWRLVGQLAAAFFYGPIHAYDKFVLLDEDNHVPAVFSGSKLVNHTQWSPTTNLQMRLGLDWGTCFDHQSKAFLIGAAWEQNIWFFHGYGSNLDRGIMNLGLGGLTATLEFKF